MARKDQPSDEHKQEQIVPESPPEQPIKTPVTTQKQSEIKRTKEEWIESAVYLGAERFEIAGALFDVKDHDLIPESQVLAKIKQFKGGE